MTSDSSSSESENELRTTDRHPMIEFIELYDRKHKVTEVEIPIPYGKLAGKWFGPKNLRPIVCLHGFQDNSGTFDRLIPLLPEDVSFLSIDFPGHGHSSRVPDGMSYNQFDYVVLLLYIMKEYNWDKISIMGHSMGAQIGFVFTALFPGKVEFLIQIDALKPLSYYPKHLPNYGAIMVTKFIEADVRNRELSEPPSYTYEEMIEKLHEATFESLSKETCPYILQRNIKHSKKFPGKYYFDRDNKVKYMQIIGWSDAVNHELARHVKVPQLMLKATQSPYRGSREGFDDMVAVLQKHNPLFELQYVNGSHHIHLTDPELVAPVITEFLKKHWVGHFDKIVSKL
ncbi:probable serine hydrolase [Malaya genurostris]|uniref:probable serine hydrolase n=1 Tax=Malaya genurostris TaxID=325434 RepID=UPI0026F3A738|nr:probable serine hydrolase [Malaya genurostris]